uniref:Uncharacterized protein n=1 Tax=Anguilla anguilla TaxID=7936 RepID=A0A0E9S1C9_ANGAN
MCVLFSGRISSYHLFK